MNLLMDRRAHIEQDASQERIRRSVIRPFEVRAADDGKVLEFSGYACITNYGYDIYGGPPYGWTEIVSSGAFKKTLSEKPDVQLLINHEDMPLARTKSGTMTLDEDDIGLAAKAGLEPEDPDVKRLAPKMARRDIDEMSFAFKVLRQRWEDLDGNEVDPMVAPIRRILEVSIHKGDVSIVNFGANDATWADLRSQLRAIANADPEQLALELRSAGGEEGAALIARAEAVLDSLKQSVGRPANADEWRSNLAAQKAALST